MNTPLCAFQPSLTGVLDPKPNDCFFQYDDYLAAGLLAMIYVVARMILDRTLFQVRVSGCDAGLAVHTPIQVLARLGGLTKGPKLDKAKGILRILLCMFLQIATHPNRVYVEDRGVCHARGRRVVGHRGRVLVLGHKGLLVRMQPPTL